MLWLFASAIGSRSRKEITCMYPQPPPYPPYPSFPPPQQRLSYRQLRKHVKSFGPPRDWAEWHYQQAMWSQYRQRRFFLLWALLSR